MKCERSNCEDRQSLLTRDFSQTVVTVLLKHVKIQDKFAIIFSQTK